MSHFLQWMGHFTWTIVTFSFQSNYNINGISHNSGITLQALLPGVSALTYILLWPRCLLASPQLRVSSEDLGNNKLAPTTRMLE